MSRSGRQQLLPNVLASWLAFAAATIIGFVMPRLVFDSVGQEMLGIWDLCWSFLAYINFGGIGMGSAIDHFSARQQGSERAAQLPKIFATGFHMQLLIGLILASFFGLVLTLIPLFFSDFGHLDENFMRQMSLLIAGTVVVLLLGETAQGALIGSHQARKTEYINILHDVSLAIAMIVVLQLDYGILGLAWTTFILRCVIEVVRFTVTWRSVPGLSIALQHIHPRRIREMALFATKTSIFGFQEMLVYQSVRVGFFISAGPAAFAAFSRYTTLVRQINRLTDRLTLAVPALTTDMSSQGDNLTIRDMYRYGVQGVMMVALPILIVFGLFGDPIVAVWMGEGFVVPGIAWTLCAGCVLHAHYAMSSKVLRGLNSHGKISLYCLCVSVLLMALFYLAAAPTSAQQAAWQLAATMLFAVHIPHIIFAAQKISFSSLRQIQYIYFKPLFYNVLFMGILILAQSTYQQGQLILSLLIAVAGVGGLACAYWYSVCDGRMRKKLSESLLAVTAGEV